MAYTNHKGEAKGKAMNNTTSNTQINSIHKRDRIVATAKCDTEIGKHKIDEGQTIEGSGHWDDEDGVYLWVYKIRFDELEDNAFDTVLPCENWDIYVLVQFERSTE